MSTATKQAPKKAKAVKASKSKKSKAELTPAEKALAEIVAASKVAEARAQDVVAARKRFEEARDILKGHKAAHLEAVTELQLAIKDSTTPHLFNPNPPLKPSANGHAPAPAGDPNAWKSEPLSVLRDLGGLTQSELERIESKTELKTMGDLSKWLTDERHQWTDLPGIGQSKGEKLQDAMEKFWAKHPAAGASPAAVVEEVVKSTELPPAEEAK